MVREQLSELISQNQMPLKCTDEVESAEEIMKLCLQSVQFSEQPEGSSGPKSRDRRSMRVVSTLHSRSIRLHWGTMRSSVIRRSLKIP